MLQKLAWLSLAGACGTVSRFALCELSGKVRQLPIPLGTFAVNILGSFLFGLIYALAQRKLAISPETRVILLTGFMGAFTTFSALMFETASLLRGEQWMLALGNVAGQVTLGLLAMGAGVVLARAI